MGCQNSTLKQAHPAATEATVTKPVESVSQIAEDITPTQPENIEEALVQPASLTVEPVETSIDAEPEVEAAVEVGSPARPAFGERSCNNVQAVPVVVAPKISFSEFLQSENSVCPQPKRKVVFDAETMRKTAPKSATVATNLTKKQKEMLKRRHVSAGRRGPVASKWCGTSQVQTDVYMEMAAAFERLLTNADTINAHLDSR